jgi:hypothetical protein
MVERHRRRTFAAITLLEERDDSQVVADVAYIGGPDMANTGTLFSMVAAGRWFQRSMPTIPMFRQGSHPRLIDAPELSNSVAMTPHMSRPFPDFIPQRGPALVRELPSARTDMKARISQFTEERLNGGEAVGLSNADPIGIRCGQAASECNRCVIDE